MERNPPKVGLGHRALFIAAASRLPAQSDCPAHRRRCGDWRTSAAGQAVCPACGTIRRLVRRPVADAPGWRGRFGSARCKTTHCDSVPGAGYGSVRQFRRPLLRRKHVLAARRSVWSLALRGSRRSVISSPVSESVRWHCPQKRFMPAAVSCAGVRRRLCAGSLTCAAAGPWQTSQRTPSSWGITSSSFPNDSGPVEWQAKQVRTRAPGSKVRKTTPFSSCCPGVMAIAVDRPIPRHSVFAIGFAIDSGDERNRLKARAEGPIAGLRRRGWRERMGVRGVGLRRELGRMARAAGFGAGIAGWIGGESGGTQAERGQSGEAHSGSPSGAGILTSVSGERSAQVHRPLAQLGACATGSEADTRHELAVTLAAEIAGVADVIVAEPADGARRVVDGGRRRVGLLSARQFRPASPG